MRKNNATLLPKKYSSFEKDFAAISEINQHKSMLILYRLVSTKRPYILKKPAVFKCQFAQACIAFLWTPGVKGLKWKGIRQYLLDSHYLLHPFVSEPLTEFSTITQRYIENSKGPYIYDFHTYGRGLGESCNLSRVCEFYCF